MSVAPMKAVSIIGLQKYFDKVINILGDSQVFEPENVTTFYSDTEKFVSFSEPNRYAELLTELDNALAVANVEPELTDISDFSCSNSELIDYCTRAIENLNSRITKVSDKEAEIEKCSRSIEQTSHFLGVKLDMDRVRACEYIRPRFGRMPVESMRYLEKYDDNPYVMFVQTAVDKEYVWGVYMAPVDNEEDIDRIFSGMLFEKCDVSDIEGTPEAYIAKKQNEKELLEQELDSIRNEVTDFKTKNYDVFLQYYTKLNQKTIYQNMKSYAMLYNKSETKSFVLCGWIPAENVPEIEKKLRKVKSVEWQTDDALNQLEKSPPIKLKDSWISRPYKFYVEMYGVPKYNEVDPTTFMAITYTVLFGAMFGDFGHGIVLAIAGYIMYRFKNMKVGKILIPCGISSSLFGLLFGSVFGFEEAFNGIYKSLFGLDEKPVEVMGKDIITVILASVFVGVSLVLVAMGMNIYSSLKQKNYGSALFGSNGVAGMVVYATVCAGIVLMLMFDINIFNIFTILALIVLPFVLIFLAEPLGELVKGEKNWKPEKWGDYCTQNGFEMFEVILSYLSNTMSFLRVGAFVMVHAGMMQVVFTLIELVGGVGSVGGIITLVLGNLFVIALEGLLVSIQTLRLEFYEMFSRFYSGTGRPYNPVVLRKVNSLQS